MSGCALMVLHPGKCSFWIVLKTANGAVERKHICVVNKAIFGHKNISYIDDEERAGATWRGEDALW